MIDPGTPAPSWSGARLKYLTSVAEQPLHRALGLADGELDRIRELLAREPNHFELAVFSLLWSEHCAYKHSAPLLRRFPTSSPRVLQGPGENAGVVDLGEGEAVAFKVESHNHPSAVEPFQGAATGIGGILRDIVAMGARPIALLDGLRFGKAGHMFERAVAGIAHYGNSVGVPTVGGDTVFDSSYAGNCLVNAMCVGLLPTERVLKAQARGAGNVVFLYGATTGRDGIGGASVLASQELAEEDADKRPSVQIGDPFTGKKLIEVSLELVERGLVESLQDLGAAGLASSLAEMARGGNGIDVHLDRVPLREEEMEPWEIMISESQERMVAVVRPEQLAAVEEVCARWELDHAAIGEVTDTGELHAYLDDELAGAIPASHLTDEAPRYEVARQPRPAAEPAPAPAGPTIERALLELLASPNVRSRAWIYRRYDHLVGSRTVRRPGLDAAVLRLRPSYRGLAVSLDGSGRIARLDPHTGGALAVLEAARNVACAGGEPLAVTDCLNFGNPEKPEVAWELAEAIEGMAAACEALGVPVVSGNVSLYNETDGRAIHPTPVVGCVGLVADVRAIPKTWREGDAIFVAGEPALSFDGSEYQALYGELAGRPAALDLTAEAQLVQALHRAAPLCSLVHDAAEGGLAVALAEAAIASGIGSELDLPDDALSLFGEGGSQVIVAAGPETSVDLPLRRIGSVGGDTLLGVPIEDLRQAWEATE
ncbi:MAG: phosphoribosylformylglycinamidine synthase subunit PurL [Actinobacteria bacterium]|nr:MAG: phosphoribosylformylglycinamidine synthase subunit PurL [Actinomycetota bacterium]